MRQTLGAQILGAITAFSTLVSASLAQEAEFKTGPVFEDFGPHAAVVGAAPVPADVVFKVSFDTKTKADEGAANRTLTSAARFINMHAAAGVDPTNINLAVVVHGKAVQDVIAASDANLALIDALTANNVRIIVCGQSAAYYGVATTDLAPRVEMALSAMTAHALLQRDGYSLNPF